jgi:hypothetical protein
MVNYFGALSLAAVAATAAAKPAAEANKLPHIFFVVCCFIQLLSFTDSDNELPQIVDDFGWAEVGYHRDVKTPEIVTPTIDALVKEGVELNRHYVHMMCTPSRASFQSGRLPAHVTLSLTGPCDKSGAIPRNMTGIAEVMKKAGYATHQVCPVCRSSQPAPPNVPGQYGRAP